MTTDVGVDDALRGADLETLDDAALDTVLDVLLGSEPPPHVMAFAEDGLAISVPPTVPVTRGNTVTGVASALELCLETELPSVVEAWKRMRTARVAQVVIHLRNDAERAITLHFIDGRQRYGVYLGFFTGSTGAISGEDEAPALFRPRLCTARRNQVGVTLEIDVATTQILGWSPAELIGRNTLDIIHPDDRSKSIANWMEMLAKPNSDQRSLVRFRHRDGSYIWFESTQHNRLRDPAFPCVVNDLVDISERMEAIAALRANEQLLRRLTEALPVGILQIDAERRTVYENDRLGEIVGVGSAPTFDEQFALVAPADRNALDAALVKLVEHGTPIEVELTVDHPNGERRCNISMRALTAGNGSVTGAIACVTDTTERARLREELVQRATFDNLTRCRNRAAILENVESMLHFPEGPHIGLAVLFIDLDHFKQVNDRYGHAAGDQLLRCVGERLLSGARAGDVVGRLGGDEFLVVCPDVDTPQSAVTIAHRLAGLLAEPTSVGSKMMVPKSSIGVAWTATPLDADTLVARADAAMYEAKLQATEPVMYQVATPVARGIAPS